jgi:hypothetical protein
MAQRHYLQTVEIFICWFGSENLKFQVSRFKAIDPDQWISVFCTFLDRRPSYVDNERLPVP